MYAGACLVQICPIHIFLAPHWPPSGPPWILPCSSFHLVMAILWLCSLVLLESHSWLHLQEGPQGREQGRSYSEVPPDPDRVSLSVTAVQMSRGWHQCNRASFPYMKQSFWPPPEVPKACSTVDKEQKIYSSSPKVLWLHHHLSVALALQYFRWWNDL